MTAAVDHPGIDWGPAEPGLPPCGPRLVRIAVEHPANRPSETLSRAEIIDGIAEFEAAKNALDAAQAEWIRLFARAEAAHQIEHGLTEPEKIDRSIAGQLSPACRVSVTEARKRVRVARDLHDGLDHLRALFHPAH